MATTNEAIARVKIDALLAAQGWNTQDTNAIRYEVVLSDGKRADYVMCDRHGRSLAVIESKRFSVNPSDASTQAKNYAQQVGVPYVFLSNGVARFTRSNILYQQIRGRITHTVGKLETHGLSHVHQQSS